MEAAAKFKAVFEASWIEQGVYDVAALAAYLALPEVAYDPVNGYQKLMTEKWWLLFEWMGSLNDWM